MDPLQDQRDKALKIGAPNRRARERVEELLDPGSFLEVGLLAQDQTHGRADKSPADALIAGYGRVNGQRVGVISLDGAVLAGSGGHAASAKQARIVDEAYRRGFPLITFGEGGGGRIPDMMGSSLGFAGAIARTDTNVLTRLAHRDRPFALISCCMGEMYGDPSFKLGLADFPLMVKTASLGVSGPPVIRAALGEVVSSQELGGPQVHGRNGQVARIEDSEAAVIATVRDILDLISVPQRESADPVDRETSEIADILPASHQRAYNVRKVVRAIVDQDCEPLELWPEFGPTAQAYLARLGGRTVAVFASNPLVQGGVFDVDSARKGSLLIRRCDRFQIPMLFLHDVPGFIIGKQAEADGLLGFAMQYISDLASSSVPKLSLVLRKAYGLAYFAMAGPGWGGDYVAALPSARMAFMGAEPGINLVYEKKLAEAEDRGDVLAELTSEWNQRAEPWEAAQAASIDDIIEPRECRVKLIQALRALSDG
jgi:acetyl-CoA carboxylase carboxyltransferase component